MISKKVGESGWKSSARRCRIAVDGRSGEPAHRRRELPGSRRSPPGAPHGARDAVVPKTPQARREIDRPTPGGELMDAAEGRGGAMKEREEVHRIAKANKAFSHFRF